MKGYLVTLDGITERKKKKMIRSRNERGHLFLQIKEREKNVQF